MGCAPIPHPSYAFKENRINSQRNELVTLHFTLEAVQDDVHERMENPEADMCVYPPKPPPDIKVPEDITGEFTAPLALSRPREGPRVINVGIPGVLFASVSPCRWPAAERIAHPSRINIRRSPRPSELHVLGASALLLPFVQTLPQLGAPPALLHLTQRHLYFMSCSCLMLPVKLPES
jgi:hypothetical protein